MQYYIIQVDETLRESTYIIDVVTFSFLHSVNRTLCLNLQAAVQELSEYEEYSIPNRTETCTCKSCQQIQEAAARNDSP